ncbi:MAG: hypothetical protein WCA27_07290 [Candidatus Sulfotelmatobacter sp.]
MTAKTPWEITRIARCGGLSKLNREQRRYTRGALQTMLDHGGMIHGHRCHTNVRVLALTDFLYGNGRIVAYSGTVNGGTDHAWCEVDGAPFEVSYPLVLIDTEREAREFTLGQMHGYQKSDEKVDEYEYSRRWFPHVVWDILQMTHPTNYNLPPERVEAIVADLLKKRTWTLPASFPGGLAKIGQEVSAKYRKIWDAGCLPGENRHQLVERAYKESDQFYFERLVQLLEAEPLVDEVRSAAFEDFSDTDLITECERRGMARAPSVSRSNGERVTESPK